MIYFKVKFFGKRSKKIEFIKIVIRHWKKSLNESKQKKILTYFSKKKIFFSRKIFEFQMKNKKIIIFFEPQEHF